MCWFDGYWWWVCETASQRRAKFALGAFYLDGTWDLITTANVTAPELTAGQ